MMIILPRIIRERLSAQLSARPREIKRMFQEMLCRDVIVDFFEMMMAHKIGSYIFVSLQMQDKSLQVFSMIS